MERRRWRAMGSDCEVIVVGDGALLDVAVARVEDLEAKWSRFRDDSEVSRLNEAAGSWVEVSSDTALLVERAVDAWRLSGGSVDPTVLGDLLRAGYGGVRVASVLSRGCAGIEIDGQRVRLPDDVGFDPGGVGKGLAADLVVGELVAAGAVGACVNLGGDLRVAGASPGVEAWTIAIEHPDHEDPEHDDPLALVGLTAGAVATSTTLKRRWEGGHHLIDPGTGLPSHSDLVLASAIAASAWIAEVLAKAVLLRGSAHPFDLLGGTGVEALALTADGRVLTSDGFDHFTGRRVLCT